jgi:hypothetical protein
MSHEYLLLIIASTTLKCYSTLDALAVGCFSTVPPHYPH